jgi:hypothetical protein
MLRTVGVLAVMTKVHHAAVDGVTGANLFSQLCSVEPDVPAPEPVEGGGSAGPLQIAVGGLVRFAVRLPDLWRLVDDFDVALEELLECVGAEHI